MQKQMAEMANERKMDHIDITKAVSNLPEGTLPPEKNCDIQKKLKEVESQMIPTVEEISKMEFNINNFNTVLDKYMGAFKFLE